MNAVQAKIGQDAILTTVAVAAPHWVIEINDVGGAIATVLGIGLIVLRILIEARRLNTERKNKSHS